MVREGDHPRLVFHHVINPQPEGTQFMVKGG